jgi:hypothetical protein
MTHTFEQDGHVIGIPDAYMSADVLTSLAEQGPRVGHAIAEQDGPTRAIVLRFKGCPPVYGVGAPIVGIDA